MRKQRKSAAMLLTSWRLNNAITSRLFALSEKYSIEARAEFMECGELAHPLRAILAILVRNGYNVISQKNTIRSSCIMLSKRTSVDDLTNSPRRHERLRTIPIHFLTAKVSNMNASKGLNKNPSLHSESLTATAMSLHEEVHHHLLHKPLQQLDCCWIRGYSLHN